MAFNLGAIAINILVSTIIISPALWLSGRLVVGGRKARFVDAVLIVAIGTIAGAVLGALFSGILGIIIQLVAWLALVKHYFECGWLTAFGISILALIVFIVVSVILGILGFALFSILL